VIQTILVCDWIPTGDLQIQDAPNHDRSVQEDT
jgi:hypothetical protein